MKTLNTPNYKKYYYIAGIFYILIALTLVAQNYVSEKQTLIEKVNSVLLASAKTVPKLLPPNFHHREMLQNGVSKEVDLSNRDHLSNQVKIMGIKYLYTVIEADNKILFTSSSATDEELATNKDLTYFGDVYDEASPTLRDVFKSKSIAYDDGVDKWGAFHTVFLPVYSEDCTLYVAAADVDLTWIDEQLNKELLNAVIYILVFFILMIPFMLIYRKQTKHIQLELENTILERTKELQQQKNALDAHAIVTITDIKGTIIFVNKKFEEVSGYTRDELIGNNPRMLNSGTYESDFWKETYHTVSHGNVWNAAIKNKAKDGTYYWVDTTIIPFFNSNGKPESYIAIQTDITALKASKELIAKKEEMLQALLNSVTEGIYGVDKLGNCTFVNKSFLRILGYDNEDDLVGKHIHELIHNSHKDGTHYPSIECKLTKAHSANEYIHTDDEVFWKRDGTSIDVECWLHPMLQNGIVVGAVATFLDITDQNALKKEHKVQEQQMLQQSRLAQMGEMIAMIAHQWRQPLGTIAATSINMKLMLEFESFDLTTQEGRDGLNDFLNEELDSINYLVQNLTTTIDDFRNFYKPDKQAVRCSFKEVVTKALKIIRTSIEVDNITLIEEHTNEIMLEMYDNEMMQVILNILKNGQDNFKEKEILNPKIKITSDRNSLNISDNGGGIPVAILDKIFDPYFSTKSEKNGTGLGLYMSKQIIEEHHRGSLVVTNREDGVCFTIVLEVT